MDRAEDVRASGTAGPPPPTRGTRIVALALIVVTAAAFAFQVRRQYFIGDDAFISFRYARHLANGQGLVWNPGEYVEGYTNFLWVVLMAGAMRIGLAPEWTSNALGIASGAGVLVLLPFLAARLSARPTLFVFVPSLALALNRTFAAWATSGLETMWFTFLVTAALFAVTEERRRDVRSPIVSAALFGLAALTRPEGVLFAGIAGVAFALDVIQGRRALRPLLTWSALVGLVVGTHLIWRRSYYGAWVPNTFTAKVSGAWWDQGLRYAWAYTRSYGAPVFAPLVVWSLWRKPDRDRFLAAACVAAYAVYVIAIGGDRFEFRFWIPVLPLACWLITDAAERSAGSVRFTAAVATALLAATLHGSLQTEDAQLPGRYGISRLSSVGQYAMQRTEEGLRLRELIDAGVLGPDLVLSVTGAGAVPYYTDWPTVDRCGLNDSYIAHLPVAAHGVIAHEHEAPAEYLARRKVVIDDTLNHLVFRDAAAIDAAIEGYGESSTYYVADIGDGYLVFDAFVPEADVRGAFSKLPKLSVRRGVDRK